MSNDLAPYIESGARVRVYLDFPNSNGEPIYKAGTIQHPWTGTEDQVILTSTAQRTTIIPANRVMWVENVLRTDPETF